MVQIRHLVLLLALFSTRLVLAQTVWNGPVITFTKAPNADPAQAANQDRITSSTWITRGSSQGLFNIAPGAETAYESGVSPANTEWATGSLANYATLTYQPWEFWAGGTPNIPSIVGKTAVVHLIEEDIYLTIKFTAWGQRPASGANFSYERSTIGTTTPVKLAGFTASKLRNAIALQWKTASEENVASFTLERSPDGKTFTAIGTVAATGNSSSEQQYSFTDNTPLSSNFYRLRTNDNNGSFSYSQVVVYKLSAFTSLQLFPNPVSSVLHLQYNAAGQTTAEIFDPAGRVVKRLSLSAGENAVNVDVAAFKPGLYLLMIGSESKPFLKE